MNPPLGIIDLGRRSYGEVLEMQRALREDRISGRAPDDMLLLVEHPPVYTLGRGTQDSSLTTPVAELRNLGAEVFEIERGGDVTWHGPGQLVGYPILHLSHHREDLHWYLRTLEQSVIDALGILGVAADRNPGNTGVWTSGRKIASIGIHVRQWVTLHGFALNVHPDLRWFDAIVPCGIQDVRMTSVARELQTGESEQLLWNRSRDAIISAFGRAFARDPRPAYPSQHG